MRGRRRRVDEIPPDQAAVVGANPGPSPVPRLESGKGRRADGLVQ